MVNDKRVTTETVQTVARLARLRLEPDEVRYFETHLARILDYFNTIDAAQDHLPAGFRSDILGVSTPERADVMTDEATLEAAMSIAPRRAGTAFQVPRIVE